MKRVLTAAVVLCMLLTIFPVAVSASRIYEVSTFADLKTRLQEWFSDESADNPTTIVIKNNIAATGEIEIRDRYKVIVSDGDNTISRDTSYDSSVLTLKGSTVISIGGVPGYGKLTFDGGSSPEGAYAARMIYNDYANLNVTGAAFQNFKLREWNGIIGNWGGQMSLSGCTFTGVEAQGSAGAIFNSKSAAHAVISDCTFEDNNGIGSGSAIFNESGAYIEVLNTTFDTCSSSGGVIFVKDNGFLTVTGSIFKDCAATGAGGAIAMRDCNSGNNINIQNSEFYNCVGDYGAGAIFNWNSILNVTNSKFKNCAGAILTESGAVTTIIGGRISECQKLKVDSNSFINIGGNITISPDTPFELGTDRAINIVSDITSSGAAANMYNKAHGTVVVTADTPELLAANHMKFAVDGRYGVDSDGKVDTSLGAPVFITPSPSAKLSLTGTVAKVEGIDGNLGNAVLIVAAYSNEKRLTNVTAFDISVTEATPVTKDVGSAFAEGSDFMKIMLWDKYDSIMPLTDVFSTKE